MRTYFVTIAAITALLLLEGFVLLPLLEDDYAAINSAGLQRTRAVVLATSALTLLYRPTAEHTQALSDMQTTLPLFEARQAALGTDTTFDVELLLDAARPDFLAIDDAAKAILHSPGPPGGTEVDIILAHYRPYRVTMNQLVSVLQHHAEARTTSIIIIESAIIAGLVVVAVARMVLSVRRQRRVTE